MSCHACHPTIPSRIPQFFSFHAPSPHHLVVHIILLLRTASEYVSFERKGRNPPRYLYYPVRTCHPFQETSSSPFTPPLPFGPPLHYAIWPALFFSLNLTRPAGRDLVIARTVRDGIHVAKKKITKKECSVRRARNANVIGTVQVQCSAVQWLPPLFLFFLLLFVLPCIFTLHRYPLSNTTLWSR